MSVTNVIVHVAGTPAPHVINTWSQSLARKQGVLRPRPGVKLSNLIRVDYDPDVTTARSILDFIEEHSGIKAWLVGM